MPKCEHCGKEANLKECKIVDELGTRYRHLCPDCIKGLDEGDISLKSHMDEDEKAIHIVSGTNGSTSNNMAYQPRKTTSFILGLGIVLMIIGVITIIYGIVEATGQNNAYGFTLLLSGVGCVISASLLYVIGNLSEDVHKLMCDVNYLTKKNNSKHR